MLGDASISTSSTPTTLSNPGLIRLIGHKRGAASPQNPLQTQVVHNVHWTADGNVLLQIRNVRFKVHRSRLASQSIWFKNLFERRLGVLRGDEFEDQEEIDQAVSSASIVDGLDLFHLNYPDGPTAAEFADFLTAMDTAIEYLDDPPSFPILANVFVTAVFYRFRSYKRAMENRIEALFPDSVGEITSTTIPYSVDAFNLGRTYAALNGIVPRTLYELARMPANFRNSSITTDENGPARRHPMARLSAEDLLLLMDVQKELVKFWDTVIAIFATQADCPDLNCSPALALHEAILIRKSHPLDPIVGLRKLLVRLFSSKSLCRAKVTEISDKLIAERDNLWRNMKYWSGVMEE